MIDIEEHFEIDLKKAYEVDGLEYKGLKVIYKEDTNTLVFYKNYGEDFEYDYDTIIYRNYSVDDIKKILNNELEKSTNNEMEL